VDDHLERVGGEARGGQSGEQDDDREQAHGFSQKLTEKLATR
jgi:hypothetical protein